VNAVPPTPHLERYRKWRAYSRADLAKAADVSERTIFAAERGQSISLRSLRKLAEALDVEPSDLTGEQWGLSGEPTQ